MYQIHLQILFLIAIKIILKHAKMIIASKKPSGLFNNFTPSCYSILSIELYRVENNLHNMTTMNNYSSRAMSEYGRQWWKLSEPTSSH